MTGGSGIEEPQMMTPSQVAAVFGVDAKTVTRWARDGHLRCIRTPGGHRRFAVRDVDALLAQSSADAPE